MLALGEGKFGVGGEPGAEGLPVMLILGGKLLGRLAEGKAEKFAEAMLVAFQVVKAPLGFFRKCFLQTNPVRRGGSVGYWVLGIG
jgi:hypothetical protein